MALRFAHVPVIRAKYDEFIRLLIRQRFDQDSPYRREDGRQRPYAESDRNQDDFGLRSWIPAITERAEGSGSQEFSSDFQRAGTVSRPCGWWSERRGPGAILASVVSAMMPPGLGLKRAVPRDQGA